MRGDVRIDQGAHEVCSTELQVDSAERIRVQAREWLLTVAVIVIPLIIAATVTIWSLDQVRYRPKKRRPAPVVAHEAGTPADGSVNGDTGRSASGGS